MAVGLRALALQDPGKQVSFLVSVHLVNLLFFFFFFFASRDCQLLAIRRRIAVTAPLCARNRKI